MRVFIDKRGFTIVELLAATAVFMVMMALLVGVVSQVNAGWQRAEAQKNRREAARVVLDYLVRDLEAALSPLPQAPSVNLDMNPDAFSTYRNRDALFWKAALPAEPATSDTCVIGYFVKPPEDGESYRLCRFVAPLTFSTTTIDETLDSVATLTPADQSGDYKGLVAEGVVGLWVTLYDRNNQVLASPGGSYRSTSRDDFPAMAEIALVVADPRVLGRQTGLANYSSPEACAAGFAGAQIFRTKVQLGAK